MVPAKGTLTVSGVLPQPRQMERRIFLSMETAPCPPAPGPSQHSWRSIASEVPASTVLPLEKTGPNDVLILLRLRGTRHEAPSKEGRVEALKIFFLNRLSSETSIVAFTQNLDFICTIEGRAERPLQESAYLWDFSSHLVAATTAHWWDHTRGQHILSTWHAVRDCEGTRGTEPSEGTASIVNFYIQSRNYLFLQPTKQDNLSRWLSGQPVITQSLWSDRQRGKKKWNKFLSLAQLLPLNNYTQQTCEMLSYRRVVMGLWVEVVPVWN